MRPEYRGSTVSDSKSATDPDTDTNLDSDTDSFDSFGRLRVNKLRTIARPRSWCYHVDVLKFSSKKLTKIVVFFIFLVSILLAPFPSAQASEDFTTCGVTSITPVPYSFPSGPPLMIYLGNDVTGHLDQSFIDAINAGTLPVLRRGSVVTISFQTALGEEALTSAVEPGSFFVEVSSNAGTVIVPASSLSVSGNRFSFTIDESNIRGRIDVRLKARQGGQEIRVCPEMSDIVTVDDMTSELAEPICNWTFSPDFSEVNSSTSSITASLAGDSFDPRDDRTYVIAFSSINLNGDRETLETSGPNGSRNHRLTINNPVFAAYNGGTFSLQRVSFGPTYTTICSQSFSVDPDSGTVVTPAPGTDPSGDTPVTDFNICSQVGAADFDSPHRDRFLACEQCFASNGIWTATGCIPYTDQTETVRALITIGLGIGGGVVVMMVLAGAFLLSTSQGDPKRVDEAKSLITSAIAGLLFVIFSVTILRFIGVNILQLPEFG